MMRKITIVLAATFLSGCGAYLHRPALEASTAKIKSDLSAMPVPAYLAEQQQRLATFASDEDRALIGYLTASRDYSLLNVLHPSAGSSLRITPSQSLHDAVSLELGRLTGTAVLTFDISKKVQTARQIAATRGRATEAMQRMLDENTTAYRQAGGTGKTDCASVTSSKGPGTDSVAASQYYKRLGMICTRLSADKANAQACDLGLAGELQRVCARIKSSTANQTEKHIKEMGKAIAALQALANPPAPEQATAEVRALLDEATEAFDAVSEISANERYARILAALNKAFGVELNKALTQVGELPKGKKAARAKQSLLAALQAIDAIDTFSSPHGTPLDQPSALLIGVAKTQHDLNIAKLELEEEKTLIAVYEQESAAIRDAIHFFARAQDILCPGNAPCTARRADLSQPAVAEALGYYLNGFNGGVIPFEVLQFREIQVKRAYVVRRAQVSEADYRALIQPAIDQMAAYGAGGIKPEHLAPLLGSLPPTGAILTK